MNESAQKKNRRSSFRSGAIQTVVGLLLLFISSTCEVQGRVTVNSADSPTFQIEEQYGCNGVRPGFASGLRVMRAEDHVPVWETKGDRRQFASPIIYGQPPEGWTNRIGPEALEPDTRYVVRVHGGVGLNGFAEFQVQVGTMPGPSNNRSSDAD